jgi:hypothetical protein
LHQIKITNSFFFLGKITNSYLAIFVFKSKHK